MGTNTHVCLLFLFAAWIEGVPVSRKITPSPYWRNRPTAFSHPHRKLSRPWLIRMQEELWREGSSGDGPEEGIQSILVSSEVMKINRNMYHTHSPSSRDFISSEKIPFPTIIDTRVEESSNFENELISRISMPYRGPSSLLNSFIFRPSLSPLPIETPSQKNAIETTSFYPFWSEDSWELNTRKAISDKYSDRFVIVTAISATHIYEWSTQTTPSEQHLNSNFTSAITEVSLPNTQITNIIKVPSSRSSIGTLLPMNFDVNGFHSSTGNNVSSSSHHFHSLNDYSHIDSEMFLNSSLLHVSFFLPESLTENRSKQFVSLHSSNGNNVLLDSPIITLKTELHSVVTAATFLVDSSILYNRNSSFHTVSLSHRFLLNNIHTTVTVVKNRSNPDKFVMPTLTNHKASTSSDIKVFTTTKYVETPLFPRIDSSFTELNDSIPVISLWPLDISTIVNIISHENVETFKIENVSYRQSEKSQMKSRTELIFHPITSSTKLILSDNEFGDEENISSLESSKVFEVNSSIEHSTPFIPNLDHSNIPSLQKLFSIFQHVSSLTTKKSWINEIETKNSHFIDILSNSLSLTSNNLWIESNSLLFTPITILPILSSIAKSEDFSVNLISSTKILTHGNDKSLQEIIPNMASAPEIMSEDNETSLEKGIHPAQLGSTTEFVNSSTHHITVRALSDTSDIDSTLQNTSTSVSELIFSKILSPVTTPLNLFETFTKRVDTYSLTKSGNVAFTPTSLESSFLQYKNSKSQASYGTSYEKLSSQQVYKPDSNFGGSNWSHVSEAYSQLLENKHSSKMLSLPVLPITSHSEELDNPGLFPDTSNISNIKLLNQSLNPLKSIEFVTISFSKAKASRDILNTNQLHSIKKSDNSQVPYLDSFKTSNYEGLFTLNYFTEITKLSVDPSNGLLESNTKFASAIEPSETYSTFEGKYKLEATSPYLISDELNKYVRSSSASSQKIRIESSIFRLHSSDNNLKTHDMKVSLFTTQIISENHMMTNIPYRETTFPHKTVPLYEFYSKSNKIISDNTPKSLDMMTRNTYFVNSTTTPTISRGITHDNSKHLSLNISSISHFSRRPFTAENHLISRQSAHFSHIFISEFIPSEQASFRTTSVRYSSTQNSSHDYSRPSLSNHEYFKFYENNNSDGNLLTTPLFRPNFHSEIYSFPTSSTTFIAKSKILILMLSPRFEDNLHIEVYSNQLETSLYFPHDLNSNLKSSSLFQTPEITPTKSISITGEELSYLISSYTIFPEKAETLDISKTNDILLYQNGSILSDIYLSISGDHKIVQNTTDFFSQGNKEFDEQYYTRKIMNTKSVKNAYSVRNIEKSDMEFSISKIEPLSNSHEYFVKIVETDHLNYTLDSQIIKSNYSIKKSEAQTSNYSYRETNLINKFHSDPLKSPIPETKKLELQTEKLPITESKDLTRKLELQTIESNPMKSPIPESIDLTKKLELQGTKSNFHRRETKSNSMKPSYLIKTSFLQTTLAKITELQSTGSDYHGRSTQSLSVQSSYIITKPNFWGVESRYLVRKPNSQSIESEYSTRKFEDKNVEPSKSYSTIHDEYSIHPTILVIPKSGLTSQHRQLTPSSFEASIVLSDPAGKERSTIQSSKSLRHRLKISHTSYKESSTPESSIEVASVMAISSFFGVNNSKNASSFLENNGISESNNSSKPEAIPTPSIDLTLFKDNNYWILTILEAPMKGRLPENFSHTMETRLANAYSEAFGSQKAKKGLPEPEDQFIVKILSLTSDLLLNQLDVVYVVEQAGILIPAAVAAAYLNSLRHEQLREFLGLYAILKAKPYRPSETQPTTSALPVVTIVCSIIGFLLFIFCCFCVYCRCCRPKQAEDTTSRASSVSGSLQRSLERHGQHNRKHLFREMTTEMVRHEEPKFTPESYALDKGDALQADKTMKMLKILESKDASTSPIMKKHPRDHSKMDAACKTKKALPKLKKRGKIIAERATKETRGKKKPSVPKTGEEIPENERKSPDSKTSSRHPSSSLPSSKFNEFGSDSTELLPPLQDLINKSKADSEANVANTQVHLSKVRQRITELLDDAFALAGGRKFYGSLRSKRIEPIVNMFPRYASLRSQSAVECSVARQEESIITDRRPISEGGQQILGAITDDGQLIIRPPPKLVWDQDIEDSTLDVTKQEVIEAHNRNINFFPFQQQSKLRQISLASTSSSLPILDTLHEALADLDATSTTANVLRESASEIYLAHSSNIHPATVDQYDELDVVSALKEGEPVVELIQAIRKELQRFSGSLPENNYESNA